MFRSCPDTASANDVMVTGIGMVTPLGIGASQTWQKLLAGQQAGRLLTDTEIDHFDSLCRLLKRPPGGAPVDHDEVTEQLANCGLLFNGPIERREYQKSWGRDCLNNLLALCLNEALEDANLETGDLGNPRTGCFVGTSKASLRAMEERSQQDHTSNSSNGSANDLWHSGFMPDAPLRTVVQLTGILGPSNCPVAACATGMLSILEAAASISSGICDVCIAGSADASLRSSVLAGFHRLGVTSKNDNPAAAGRPFDRNRDGFIVGEGSAVVILESREHLARRRGHAYAAIDSGFALTDCTGMTQIDCSGRVVQELLSMLNDQDPDLIGLHGTATSSNDQAEASGVRQALPHSQIPQCFSTKGATGHLLGATASVEFGLTCLALAKKTVPGTTNFDDEDPSCGIPVSSSPVSVPFATSALKLSLGFGGHVAGCRLTTTE